MTKNDAPVDIRDREPDAGDWRRHGYKKVDSIMVASEHGQVKVEVRLNSDTGMFGAALRDKTFYCRDLKALQDAMSAHLKSLDSLEFTRWISVQWEKKGESHRGRRGSKCWHGHNEDMPVAGIYLEFDVYDVSQRFETAVHYGRHDKVMSRVWRRLEQDMKTGEWSATEDDNTVHDEEDDAFKDKLEFSMERVQSLRDLQRGIGKIADMLDLLFSEKALESGAGAMLLDKAAGQRLLPPPALEAPKLAKKGRKR